MSFLLKVFALLPEIRRQYNRFAKICLLFHQDLMLTEMGQRSPQPLKAVFFTIFFSA